MHICQHYYQELFREAVEEEIRNRLALTGGRESEQDEIQTPAPAATDDEDTWWYSDAYVPETVYVRFISHLFYFLYYLHHPILHQYI